MIRTPSSLYRPALAALFGLCSVVAASGASAQSNSWPTRPVRLVVAFAAGGLADVMARVIQPQLTEALGQPVVIDNRGGAGGNVAGTEVVRNGNDGHTFLITVSTTESVNPMMFARMPFDPQKDLQPVALLANSQLFLITRTTLQPNNLKDFVAYAKAHPDTMSYGSAGNGTTPHLAGELLKQSAGITATHLPYRGAAPVIQDVMAGQIDFGFAPGTVFPTVKAGKLKVLAVASRKRTVSAPDVPTFSELGINGVYADTYFGIYAPAGMPAATVERMNREINKILSLPAVQARFIELGAQAVPVSRADYKSMVQTETKLFTEIVKARGITAD
ncbi:Bug family tripartite tricarboxylate transporter substrate binding protein [Variovorax paradoxus]|uniref:Bug family tripartite tricarboxylate transporter substrate binding protein n=1 Tax=Variovorax paradoxus TaxID=34073 RepID=UPI002783AABD|nr:tripartite tricarboxylate transporter substrate binding protein [Variovorax paradoxus]MDP9932768.1 tripartite-type tricarboxylate transporter receptor subunit TctC [Variovorax paradoxus]